MRFNDSLLSPFTRSECGSRRQGSSPRRITAHRAALALLATLVLASGLVACGKDAAEPAPEGSLPGVSPSVALETESEAEFQAGADVPVPAGEPLLTIRGDLRSKNAEDALTLDLDALRKLGTVSYETTPPGEAKAVRYTGVLLTTILRVAGNTQAVAITAVMDEDTDARIPIQSILDQPVMLAFEADGKPLEGADGPLRIVFPYEQVTDPAAAAEMSIGGVVQLIID